MDIKIWTTTNVKRISVIIPCLNSQRTIASVLEAILKCKPHEVIVVDDGSTDNSIGIIRNFPVKLIALGINYGPAYARNIGASAATGDIFLFVDSDVIVPIDYTIKVLTSLRRCDAVIGMPCKEPSFSNLSSKHFNWRVHYNYMKLDKEIDFLYGSFLAIKKEVFLASGKFNSDLKECWIEDNEFGYEVFSRGYRIHINKNIQIKHMKHIGFIKLLKNDFWRTIGRVGLIKRKKVNITRKKFVSTPRTHVLSPILALMTVFVSPLFFISFILCYLDYLRFVWSINKLDAIRLIPLLFMDMFVVGIAVILGFLGLK